MNATELRGKNEQELRDELLALRREQFNLRMQAGVNPDAVRSDKITAVRRSIARVKTVMNEHRAQAKVVKNQVGEQS
jgi:large subunit ribosomal protein L29